MTRVTTTEQHQNGNRKMERGELINGGKFVGKTRKSSTWVWYPGSDQSFDEMCSLFDRMYR
jgi:hypothetical protein